MAKTPKSAPANETPAVRIVSTREGFRRCGIAHSVEPTDYPAGRFSEAELDALENEPMLAVVRMPGAAAPDGSQTDSNAPPTS